MTNDEIQRNPEIRMTNRPRDTRAPFDIRASDFFRHSLFVICYWTTVSFLAATARVIRFIALSSVLVASALAGTESPTPATMLGFTDAHASKQQALEAKVDARLEPAAQRAWLERTSA